MFHAGAGLVAQAGRVLLERVSLIPLHLYEERGMAMRLAKQVALSGAGALLGGFIAALYWVWSDLISVFSYLDNVTLYEYTSGTGANMSMVPISIGDMLGALIIAVLRNGFSLLSVSSAVQNLVLGLVIIGAVLLDVTRERMAAKARRLAAK